MQIEIIIYIALCVAIPIAFNVVAFYRFRPLIRMMEQNTKRLADFNAQVAQAAPKFTKNEPVPPRYGTNKDAEYLAELNARIDRNIAENWRRIARMRAQLAGNRRASVAFSSNSRQCDRTRFPQRQRLP